ncbi:hypothetical protein EG329_011825 [Mollisiaceae sp. DMI_Dod_QoI]|nr:hypothetical protein EG329_011825 [Helotiales sp. DMI_Dod_QoI]
MSDNPSVVQDLSINDNALHFGSHLMRLPAEIRIEIYKHLVITPSGNVFHDIARRFTSTGAPHLFYALDDKFRDPEEQTDVMDLSILQVCRKVREECLPIFYKCNTFYMAPLRDRHLPGFNLMDWLCRGRVQHLALSLLSLKYGPEKEIQLIGKMVDLIAEWPDFQTLKSFTLVITPDVFSSHMMSYRRSYTMLSSTMPGYLRCLKSRSQTLSGIESRKLMVFTSYQHLPAIRQIQRVAQRYDPNRYLKDLHEAFGGELWVDGILTRQNGVVSETPPFPLSCCHFDEAKVWKALRVFYRRARVLSHLVRELGSGIEFLEEAGEVFEAVEPTPGPMKYSIMKMGFIVSKIRISLPAVRTCFDELDIFLRKPDLSQSEMESKMQEWAQMFDLKMAGLPELTSVSLVAKTLFVEWQRSLSEPVARREQTRTCNQGWRSAWEEDERILTRSIIGEQA